MGQQKKRKKRKKRKKKSTFIIGFGIGILLCLVLWYWQKSTAAEDGALDLLDRLAKSESRLREIQEKAQTAVITHPTQQTATQQMTEEAVTPDDLTRIKGVGPVFKGRLNKAGITQFTEVKALTVAKLAEILDIAEGRAEDILAEAQSI